MSRTGWVYILASRNRRLYIGVTSDLQRRWVEHRTGIKSRFPSQYQMTRLVFVKEAPSITDAIAREKQLKGWVRRKKVALIERSNPTWSDLAEGYGWKLDPDPPER